MSDRTVHARDGELEVVRYNRAGKWWVEYNPPNMRVAGRITLRQAVDLATSGGAEVFLGKPGGGSFDRLVSKRLDARADVSTQETK